MHCEYCNSDYEPSEIGRQAISGVSPKATRKDKDIAHNQRKIKMNIAVCNSCGGELAVSDVEVSSFCPYCGNASVVMDRVEERLAPDYMIPFKVTKEEAESIIRKRLRSGIFVPKEIKDFETERLCGIYIPFWLYDIYYGAEQKWKYKESRGKYSSVTRYALTLADSAYQQLTVDASRAFDDDASKRLEPYQMEELEYFDPVYLSGFYADRFDVRVGETDRIVEDRIKKMFRDVVIRKVPGGAEVDDERVVQEVMRRDYAFLPVWFLTFRHEDQPYTVLVNGQTKKMVGAVPVNKKKAMSLLIFLIILLGIGFACIGAWFGGNVMQRLVDEAVQNDTDGSTKAVMITHVMWVVVIAFLWRGAQKRYKAMKESIDRTRSRRHERFVKERQRKS